MIRAYGDRGIFDAVPLALHYRPIFLARLSALVSFLGHQDKFPS